MRRRDEFLGILLVAVGFLLLAALVSYHPNDPSLFSAVNDQGLRPRNWAGRFGATFADGSLQFFGLAALVAPVALLTLGWRRFLS
ncbi:MAG: DNA translocase FtsK 4TM domain-containing protein, partial [Thermoanaerobaculia bacterium]